MEWCYFKIMFSVGIIWSQGQLVSTRERSLSLSLSLSLLNLVNNFHLNIFKQVFLFLWRTLFNESRFMTRLVCMFKNWKLLFKNIFENMCGWKSMLKYIKCCLKTENSCLKTQIKHPLIVLVLVLDLRWMFLFLVKKERSMEIK